MLPMTIDAEDLRGFARACARRFPAADDQRQFAAEVGVSGDFTTPGDPELSWAGILERAERQGRLAKLAGALAKAAPGDETFAAMARALGVLAAPAGPPVATLAAAGFGALLLVGGAVAWFAGGPAADVPLPGGRAAPPAAAGKHDEPPIAPAAASAAPPEAPPPAPAVEAAPPAVAAPAAEAAPAREAAPVREAAPARAAPAAASRLPVGCTGAPAGEVVGYWYFGTASPGAQGSTITLSRDARVRADYPRRENHHDASAPERCVLTRGSRFTMTLAPMEVSRGHWWIPVEGGR